MEPDDGLSGWEGEQIYTVGHSTRTLDELVTTLRAFDISVVVDIRTVPRSRRNPQFDRDVMDGALGARGLRYVHLAELGGLRHAQKGSPNAAWRNASFRGYADHMLTPEFEAGLAKLLSVSESGRVALMCAEAVPWRCHRSLVADALTVRGANVEHITSASRSAPHRMTPFARVEGTRVTYPGDDPAGVRLATLAPLHLEATVRVLQRRPTNLVDAWEGGRYRRALAIGDDLVVVEVSNHGTIDAPDVRFRVLDGEVSAGTDLERSLRRILGLDLDPEPFARLMTSERRLASLGVRAGCLVWSSGGSSCSTITSGSMPLAWIERPEGV